MRHAARGEAIPEGWALDADGNTTTDPKQAATMAPAGGYKGFNQGLMVETMSALMSGATLGSAMSPFATDAGGRATRVSSSLPLILKVFPVPCLPSGLLASQPA
jgi:LDH2 family malate/lactate/ureidoglycolate dehydrogenase